jgi:hypothetical protein
MIRLFICATVVLMTKMVSMIMGICVQNLHSHMIRVFLGDTNNILNNLKHTCVLKIPFAFSLNKNSNSSTFVVSFGVMLCPMWTSVRMLLMRSMTLVSTVTSVEMFAFSANGSMIFEGVFALLCGSGVSTVFAHIPKHGVVIVTWLVSKLFIGCCTWNDLCSKPTRIRTGNS